ncbi:MAG: HD domain-containing protein, partial [Muribaculum sp.]|nr:HD domain-containing protein [Muribaculum sp.]
MTTELYHNICDYLRELIAGTEWEGIVYAVGGCCRDELMNLPIKDLDLAVNRPDGGIRFGRWLYEQGLTVDEPTEFVKYGTSKLNLTEFPEDEIELVQTRREKYTDRTSRNPETAFGSIEDDCVRRDLTINSLYYDITNRKFIDITNRGVDDIKNHIIRTPNDPDVTYDDDPVRILRCIRFATRFGWDIEPETYAAMVRNVDRMNIVSVERIRGELEKILLCDNPSRGLELLRQTGAMRFVIPELEKTYSLDQNHRHFGTVWEHTLKVVDKVPEDIYLRMAALLHDIGKITTRVIGSDGEVHYPRHERVGRLVNKILRRLRYRSDFIKKIEFLVVNHTVTKRMGDTIDAACLPGIRRIQYKCTTRKRFNALMA